MNIIIESLKRLENLKSYISILIENVEIYYYRESEVPFNNLVFPIHDEKKIYISIDFFESISEYERDTVLLIHLMIAKDERVKNRNSLEIINYFYSLMKLDDSINSFIKLPKKYISNFEINYKNFWFKNPSEFEYQADYNYDSLYNKAISSQISLLEDANDEIPYKLVDFKFKGENGYSYMGPSMSKYKGDILYDYWFQLEYQRFYIVIIDILKKNTIIEKGNQRVLDRRSVHRGLYRYKDRGQKKEKYKYEYLRIINYGVGDEIIECIKAATINEIKKLNKFGDMEVIVTTNIDNEHEIHDSIDLHIYDELSFKSQLDEIPENHFLILSYLNQIKDYKGFNILFENNCDYRYKMI